MLLFYLLNLLIHNPLQFILAIVILIVPLLISIAFHEWAHGFVAYKFGDPTPKMMGRLTLNPLAHLDPLGTLMLFVVGIGWAKPVVVNPLYFPDKTKQMLVALAGPGMNILLAVFFSFVFVYLNIYYSSPNDDLITILVAAISILIRINLILAIFNMIPIPPLDGSKVLAWLLPEKLAYKYLLLEQYGMMLIFLMLFTVGFKFILSFADNLQLLLLESIKNLVTNYLL